MSLTIRFCPVPPLDPRGTTSVVAIPTPSFSLAGGTRAPGIVDYREVNIHYTAATACRLRPEPSRLAPLVLGIRFSALSAINDCDRRTAREQKRGDSGGSIYA